MPNTPLISPPSSSIHQELKYGFRSKACTISVMPATSAQIAITSANAAIESNGLTRIRMPSASARSPRMTSAHQERRAACLRLSVITQTSSIRGRRRILRSRGDLLRDDLPRIGLPQRLVDVLDPLVLENHGQRRAARRQRRLHLLHHVLGDSDLVARQVSDRATRRGARGRARRSADRADDRTEDSPDLRVPLALIADVDLALHVLRDDGEGLDVLPGGLLVRLHLLEDVARGVFAVV